MTEDDAKTKWCPFVRGPTCAVDEAGDAIAVAGTNRTFEGAPGGFCIGSACMAWRWLGWDFQGWMNADPGLADQGLPRHGCCGLASLPHSLSVANS